MGLGGLGQAMEVDFNALVNDVADKFEGRFETRVTPDARIAIIKPARPYQKQVEAELKAGKITLSFLQDSIFQVLENAREIAAELDADEIDKTAVQTSMKRKCPYIMWCE